MAREQERRNAAMEFGRSINSIRPDLHANSFEQGAKWADKTMIDKAVEWMKQLIFQEFPGAPVERLIDDEMIAEFRKEMEEGQ